MKSKLNNTSVVIVTYNHGNFIKKCLESIAVDTALEIIVVDNCSSDDTVNIVKEFPFVKLVKNEDNMGYGNGVNIGIKYSKRKYVVVLNPDVKVEKNSIEELIKPLKDQKGLITVPKTLLYDGSKINTCGNIAHFTGLTFTLGLGEDKNAFNKPMYATGLSGVGFAIERDLYLKLGGFDESFFLYMEDAELSWNIQSKGLKILYVPSSVIYHDYKLMVPAEKIYHLEKGRYVILRKYMSWKYCLMFLPSLLMTEILTFGYSIINSNSSIKFKFRAIKDGLTVNIHKKNPNINVLVESLDWKIPEGQLSYTVWDRGLKRFANVVYLLNYNIFKKMNHNNQMYLKKGILQKKLFK